MSWYIKFLIGIPLLGAIILSSGQALAQQWRPVRGGILYGISGMALVKQQDNILDFLVVHDNKQKDQGRLAIINIRGEEQPNYLPVKWSSNIELPIDLEGLTSVPGTNTPSFMALSSSGKIYHISLNNSQNTISVIKEFELPKMPKGTNLESFALQQINGKLVAVWAHRGDGEEAATIYWGLLDLAKYRVTQISSANLKVPLSVANVRHISDLKIDSAGVVFITSASDAGDDGPFQSGVYVAGTLGLQGRQIIFKQNSQLVPLYHYNYHKIEAIELVAGEKGGVILGTDDENMGSSILIN